MEKEKLSILNDLIGPINEETANIMSQRLECFLHPSVSVFIPATGQCPFALTPNHSHPGYSFIYYMQPVSDFIVEGKHMSYPLNDGKCLSAMSPDIAHQEIQSDYFQSYIAIVVDATLFEKNLLEYSDKIPTFKGEACLPTPELISMLEIFMIESRNHSNYGLMNQMAELLVHMLVRSVIASVKINETDTVKTNETDTVKSNETDIEKTKIFYDRLEVDRAIAYMNSHM